jgi:hypothetical protein
MARGEDVGRLSPFERMLDELDNASENDAFLGDECVVWPRASPVPRGEVFVSGESVESLYVESGGEETPPQEPPQESLPSLPSPGESLPASQKSDLAADFAGLRQELAAARGPGELRQLRRRCALILHPDRVAPVDRALAEKFMAEVNAAIDCAIRGETPAGKRPAGFRL